MNDIAIESFSGNKKTVKSPIIHMRFNHFAIRNSIFYILKTNLPCPALL